MTMFEGFLRTGKLGEVTLGAAKDAVQHAFGGPNKISEQRNPEIWEYAALHLSFYKPRGQSQGTLVMILLSFAEGRDEWPAFLGPRPWPSGSRITFAQFHEFLISLHIPIKQEDRKGPHDRILLESDVNASFVDGELTWLSITAARDRTERQLTVQIPQGIFDRIRTEAAQRKMSVSALCSQWILEHVNNGAGSVLS